MALRYTFWMIQMNIVQKFNRFDATTYNGFDVLKNSFLTRNPVKYVDDPSDYSQATEFYGKSEFVILVKNGIKLQDLFPYWLKPKLNELNVAYEFPVVFKETQNIKSWGEVILVPTDGIVTETKRKSNIASFFDAYNGKEKFDLFFIGSSDNQNYKKLLESHPHATAVDTVEQASTLSSTEMFWTVPDNVDVADGFMFDFKPNERAFDYPHVFGNGEITRYDGIFLIPKSYIRNESEIRSNFFARKRIIREVASYPK